MNYFAIKRLIIAVRLGSKYAPVNEVTFEKSTGSGNKRLYRPVQELLRSTQDKTPSLIPCYTLMCNILLMSDQSFVFQFIIPAKSHIFAVRLIVLTQNIWPHGKSHNLHSKLRSHGRSKRVQHFIQHFFCMLDEMLDEKLRVSYDEISRLHTFIQHSIQHSNFHSFINSNSK